MTAPAPGCDLRNALGMRLVWISPGVFLMGSPEEEDGREEQECTRWS